MLLKPFHFCCVCNEGIRGETSINASNSWNHESLNNRPSSSWIRKMKEYLTSQYGLNATGWPSRSYPPRNIWAWDTSTSGEKCNEGLRGVTSINASNSWNQIGGRTYNAYSSTDGTRNSNALWCQNGAWDCTYRTVTNEFVRMAKTLKGSLELQRRVQYEARMLWQEILDGVLESIFEVMTDKYGHHLFLKLLKCCNVHQFQTIFVTLASNEDLLINASLLKHGSSAVQGFIKKLKATGSAHSITLLLSKRFVELMTSEHGRHVVLQCLKTFETKENEVLFRCAMSHFKELATTEYGCLSLNACLSCIDCDVQRTQLLENIADESNFLVNDPWGLIVLEKVLTLNNNKATRKICDHLKMQYINLAQRKGGSRVVQKCIRASEYGMKSFVKRLLGSENALQQLSCDQFGNYVIQAALLSAKNYDIKLYEVLVAALKPHYLALSSTKYGRQVNILIKGLENSKVKKTTRF